MWNVNAFDANEDLWDSSVDAVIDRVNQYDKLIQWEKNESCNIKMQVEAMPCHIFLSTPCNVRL